MEVDSLTFTEFIEILKRRKWCFFLTFGLIATLAFSVAFLLPPVYMSSAKILIEEQEVPHDFVQATVTSYAEQRVQAIEQRILSSSRLNEIIKRLNLYPKLRDEQPIEQIISQMREDILVESISVDVVNKKTGREVEAIIAFVLSYQSRNPDMAQQVTNLLASMFLEENLKIRERQTEETTQFLEKEISKLEKDLESIEGEIAVFKEKHINELPSLLQLNIQTLQGIDTKIEKLNEELLAKKERIENFKSQLANMPEASREMADQKRLEELEASLANLKSQYTDAYPDVIRIKGEIADLKVKIASSPEDTGPSKEFLDNPAYVNLNSQISNISADINSLKRQIAEYRQKEGEYKKRIETSLRVEEEFRAFDSKRNSTQSKINDLMQKLMEAKVSYGLEKEQKGERFTLVEPANYPGAPFKPNRRLIIILGLIAGFGLGTCTVAFREYIDHSIYDEDTLASSTSYPVLGSVPLIVTSEDISRKRMHMLMFFSVLVPAVVGGYFLCSYFFPYALSQVMEKIIQVMP